MSHLRVLGGLGLGSDGVTGGGRVHLLGAGGSREGGLRGGDERLQALERSKLGVHALEHHIVRRCNLVRGQAALQGTPAPAVNVCLA